MTIVLFFLGLLTLPSILTLANDPAPGLMTTVEESRRLTCERASLEAARNANPGLIEETRPRGEFLERSAVLCTESVVSGRNPRDAAILAELVGTTSDLAGQLATRGDDDRNWMVEVHYPSAPVSAKIAFATKSALMESGFAVTDRLPVLAVGDIEVLSSKPPFEAYPLACKRYFAAGRLDARDAVLSLLVLDSRETTLHAGTCIDGRWRWVR